MLTGAGLADDCAYHGRICQKEYNGKIGVFKVNTDAEQELAQLFQIRSIPAVTVHP